MILFGIDFTNLILVLKVLGFITSLSLIVGIIISWLGKKDIDAQVAEKRNVHFNLSGHTETGEQKRWKSIKKMFHSQNPAEWRAAIIDADAMLEDLITAIGYKGVSFGEKLKSIEASDFPHLNDAWHVHKLRNIIAHEGSRYHLSERENYQTFKIYESIFEGTGYIA